MPQRIALASTDGKMINTHFGHAEAFHIFDLTETGYSYVETRDTASCCIGHDHSQAGLNRITSLISDCRAVFVSRIGPGAAGFVMSKGIRVFEAPGFVDEVLQKVVDSKLLSDESGSVV